MNLWNMSIGDLFVDDDDDDGYCIRVIVAITNWSMESLWWCQPQQLDGFVGRYSRRLRNSPIYKYVYVIALS